MRIPTPADLERAALAAGWTWHREPYRQNIVVLRKIPGTLDAFDDMFTMTYHDASGRALLWACRCTADPGKPSREHPKRRDGTAVLRVGQMIDGFRIGIKYGKPGTADDYRCWRPVRPVPVLRYTSIDDPTGTPSTSDTLLIHRASAVRESTIVGDWSEACCVIANPADYDHALALGDLQVTQTGRLTFTVGCLEWPAVPPRVRV